MVKHTAMIAQKRCTNPINKILTEGKKSTYKWHWTGGNRFLMKPNNVQLQYV